MTIMLATSGFGLSACAATDTEACAQLETQLGILAPIQSTMQTSLLVAAASHKWNSAGMNAIADQLDRVKNDISSIQGSDKFESATKELTQAIDAEINSINVQLRGIDGSKIEADLVGSAARLKTVCH